MKTYIDDNKKIEILYEDKHILVCVKPAGVLSQSGRIMDRDMVSMCRNYLAAKGENSYIAIINRLDRPVEGITLFAKDSESVAVLSKAMREHDFCKYYRAKVLVSQGNPNDENADADNLINVVKKAYGEMREVVLEDYLRFDKGANKTFICSKGDKGAKYAKLSYRITAFDESLSVADVSIKLFTGRHHQIRAQLANAGMPIVGDVRYGYKGQTENPPKGPVNERVGNGAGTISLWAVRLEIKHPATGKSMVFTL